jgi:LysR family glycine cleavage system transcriptional activator
MLEEWLGAPLFHRGNRGHSQLMPTETAERALPDIRAGFDRLAQGLEQLQEGLVNGVLTVTVSSAFAAKWLLPRIHHFQTLCPDIDVRLETSLKPADFIAQRVDIGVRYGADTIDEVE